MKRVALLIATSAYADLPALPSAAAGAEHLANVLAEPLVGDYDVTAMIDAPLGDIWRRLFEATRHVPDDGQLFIYFSGHGLVDREGELYLAFRDTDPSDLEFTGLSVNRLGKLLSGTASHGTKIIVLDCCYSGRVARDLSFFPRSIEGAVLTSSTANSPAFWDPESEASAFTGALIEGLEGAADTGGDGSVDLQELYGYLRGRMAAAGVPTMPSLLTRGSSTLVLTHPGSGHLTKLPSLALHPNSYQITVDERTFADPKGQPTRRARRNWVSAVCHAFMDGIASVFDPFARPPSSVYRDSATDDLLTKISARYDRLERKAADHVIEQAVRATGPEV